MSMNTDTILAGASRLAEEFASERAERQRRKTAERTDFDRLRDAGIPLMALPVEFGGTWESLAQSVRPMCNVLRTLAHGDPSVSLVSSMHPLVLSAWRIPQVPKPFAEAWNRQRSEVFDTVHEGAWWGTIISEPGSGGDIAGTRSVAALQDESKLAYRLSGQKHFGSGSGVTSFMTTRAIPSGETNPDMFFLDFRGAPWDGSTGVKLVAEWAGHGMMSTNSHGFEFTDFPATRVAWPGHQSELMSANPGLGNLAFAAVIVGVIDAAMDYTRQRLSRSTAQGTELRAFQKVAWAEVEQEAWLIEQGFEGAVRAFEQGKETRKAGLMAKQSIAGLAESVMSRLCRIAGGSSYTWYSPLGAWFEDVRSLGYLRPPWPLAFDQVFDLSFEGRDSGSYL